MVAAASTAIAVVLACEVLQDTMDLFSLEKHRQARLHRRVRGGGQGGNRFQYTSSHSSSSSHDREERRATYHLTRAESVKSWTA